MISKHKEYIVSQSNKQAESHFKLHKWFLSKKWLIIFVLLIFVITGVSTYFFYSKNNSGTHSNNNTSQTKNDASNTIKNTRSNKVASIVKESGTDAAQSYLDEQLNAANDTSAKADIYFEKALLLQSQSGGDLSQALTYAYKAESLSPTKETSLLVATLEENNHNIPIAIQYYKIYLSRSTQDSKGSLRSDSDYDYYLTHISNLETIGKQ